MGIAEDAAATYYDITLTEGERSDLFEAYRSVGLSAIVLPFTVGENVIDAMAWDGSVLTLDGSGSADFPIRVVNLPFLVPDDTGLIEVDGRAYTFDVAAVLMEVMNGL